MKYIAIVLTMLLVFGCVEVCAEEYIYKYYVENGIVRVEKVKKEILTPSLSCVNSEGIFQANCVECNNGETLLLFKAKDYIFDKEIDKQLQTELKEILEYYKKEYDFYARLVVRMKGKKCYFCGTVIFISMEVVDKDAIKMNWDKERLIKFILLHEIQHAIDYKYNRKQLMEDERYSKKNKIPHNKRPHEIRANNFAWKEINKWVNKENIYINYISGHIEDI